jgi:hypothetical protein
MNYTNEPRIVLTLDAGGTNFVLLQSRDKNERLISQAVELGDYTQALPPLDAVK